MYKPYCQTKGGQKNPYGGGVKPEPVVEVVEEVVAEPVKKSSKKKVK